MKKGTLILFIVMLLILLVYYVPQISFDKATNEARGVIKKHVEYINNKNWEEYTAIVVDMLDKIPDHVKTADDVKILWIINSRKKLTTKLLRKEMPIYDVRVFKVVYYIKNKNLENQDLAKNLTGIQIEDVVIVKETKESPWLYGPLGAYEFTN